MSKICIYTSVVGGYEPYLRAHPDIEGVDWVAFVDKPMYAKGDWKQIKMQSELFNHRLQAKWFKVHPHVCLPEYATTLWVDGSVEILSDKILETWLPSLNESDIALFKHPERDCIYDEAVSSSRMNKYKNQRLLDQVNFYRQAGFPEHNGLWACGLMLRNKTEKVREAMEKWWSEIFIWSIQDQLSFPVACKMAGVKPAMLPGNQYNNPLFKLEMQPFAS